MKSLITADEARCLCDKELQQYISIVKRIKIAASGQRKSIFIKSKELSDKISKRLSSDGFIVVIENPASDFSWISWGKE